MLSNRLRRRGDRTGRGDRALEGAAKSKKAYNLKAANDGQGVTPQRTHLQN
jgi:hypothetical protein